MAASNNNRNRLMAVMSNQTLLKAKQGKSALYEAILKFGLQEQFIAPLSIASSFDDFSDSLGCQASIANRAHTRAQNAVIAAHWREDMPDAEKVSVNAPKVEIQPWTSTLPEFDNGQDERNYHDVRSLEECLEAARLTRTVLRSIANCHEREVQWLNGQDEVKVVPQADGTIKRERVVKMIPAYEAFGQWLVERMSHSQHPESLWYTKQSYTLMTFGSDFDFGYDDGSRPGEKIKLDIHELKSEFNKHLLEEIIVDDEVTTRLELIVSDIANRKYADWKEQVVQGKSGSPDMQVWIAYSSDRVLEAEGFLASSELEEYLDAEEEAKKALDEIEARKVRLNALSAVKKSPLTQAVPEPSPVKSKSLMPNIINSAARRAVGFSTH